MAEKKRRRAEPIASDEEDDDGPKPRSKRRQSAGAGGALSFKNRLKPDSAIISSLKQTFHSSQSAPSSSVPPKPLTLADLNLPFACREVTDLQPSSVLAAASSIVSGNGFSFSVPARGSSNQLYIPELDRIVLKDKPSARSFASLSTVRKTTITARVLSLVHVMAACRFVPWHRG